MIIDGKSIANDLKATLKTRAQHMDRRLRLGLIVVHETPEIHMFVALKKRFGEAIGVEVSVLHLPAVGASTESLLQFILHATHDHDGLVLQLPIPASFELDMVLNLFPLSHDVDVVGQTAFQQHKEHTLPFLPPVVGAMAEILHRQGVHMAARKVLVVGDGRLVGAPVIPWAENLGAQVTVANSTTDNIADLAREANVIVLGTGVPGLLKPDMVQEGVIILDAGTSEDGGVLRGDADPACAEKATIFTPTPGGIGPITVAKVFENLFMLDRIKEAHKPHVDH